MVGNLREDESRQMLREQHVGRLGCCLDSEPYVVPVSYLFEGDSIYVHSMPGRKIDTLRANPRACLQVDNVKNTYDWKSVIAYGFFFELTDQAERRKMLVRLFNHFPHLTPVESRMEANVDKAIVFCLKIDTISGVYEKW